MKPCSSCKIVQDLSEFYVDKNRRDGLAYECKRCMRAKVRAWSITPRGRARAKLAKHRYNKTEKGRQKRRDYQNTEKARARQTYARQKRARTPAGAYKNFDTYLRRTYGIDAETWARMFNKQKGKCLGCMRALSFDRTTHVDHCHKTGRVRALLCASCNSAMGTLSEDPRRMLRLMVYAVWVTK